MKMPSILTRNKKLRASTARRARTLGLPDEMDYEEMSEPNMKLSRALLIVLVLHVVAVSGIVAFNTIKTRESAEIAAPATVAPADPDAAPPAASTPAAPHAVAQAATQPAVKNTEPAKGAVQKGAVQDSGKTYTVVKGDNPVTIARHLKVSEADLLELNQITDPRKLQINQKLRIPEHAASSKSKAD